MTHLEPLRPPQPKRDLKSSQKNEVGKDIDLKLYQKLNRGQSRNFFRQLHYFPHLLSYRMLF